MKNRKIKGNGRIRSFLLGVLLTGILFIALNYKITKIEVNLVKPAQASSQIEGCGFEYYPPYDGSVEG